MNRYHQLGYMPYPHGTNTGQPGEYRIEQHLADLFECGLLHEFFHMIAARSGQKKWRENQKQSDAFYHMGAEQIVPSEEGQR